jgi:plastocyanin
MRTGARTAVFLVALLAGAAAGADKTGTVRGAVRFTGAVPPPKQVPTGDGATIDQYDLVVDPKSKGLRWVIATLENAPAQPKLGADEPPVVIDQRDMLFVPRVVAVQHGRPVRFDNSDQFNHSVVITSRLAENEMNVFVKAAEPVTKAFAAEKHPLRVGCALHGSMTAWVYVAPHPWVAVSDEAGKFALKDVPPGKYTLWLKHPDTGLEERRPVEVQAGKATDVAVEWKESKPKRDPPAHKPK